MCLLSLAFSPFSPVILPREVFEELRMEAYIRQMSHMSKEMREWTGSGVTNVSSFLSVCAGIDDWVMLASVGLHDSSEKKPFTAANKLCVLTWIAQKRRPGEINYVGTDDDGLEESRTWHSFLDSWRYWQHTDPDADEDVHNNEELGKTAPISDGVVDEDIDSCSETDEEASEGGNDQSDVTRTGITALVLIDPGFGKSVSKIYDKNELDEDEEEGADHSDVHESWRRMVIWWSMAMTYG